MISERQGSSLKQGMGEDEAKGKVGAPEAFVCHTEEYEFYWMSVGAPEGWMPVFPGLHGWVSPPLGLQSLQWVALA
jgi:hypothetical protein